MNPRPLTLPPATTQRLLAGATEFWVPCEPQPPKECCGSVQKIDGEFVLASDEHGFFEFDMPFGPVGTEFYLREKFKKRFGVVIFPFNVEHANMAGWKRASTMPEKATRYRGVVAGVEVRRFSSITKPEAAIAFGVTNTATAAVAHDQWDLDFRKYLAQSDPWCFRYQVRREGE